MADNKPKIDLKARLGKRGAPGAVGVAHTMPGSMPPPVATGSVPAPPFAGGPVGAVPLQRPMAPVGQPVQAHHHAPVARPQSITVEMSEEVIQAQRGLRKRGRILAGISAGAALVVGLGIGSVFENKKSADLTIEGAALLAQEIDEANLQINKLAEIIDAAAKKLGEGKYPTDELQQLGEVNVPFDGARLAGRGVGRLKPQTFTMLIQYASSAQEANEQKNKIRSLLGLVREPLESLLSEGEKPRLHWGVYVENGPHGPWASMAPLSAPVLVSSKDKVKDENGREKAYDWPEQFDVNTGGKKAKIARFTGGKLPDSDPELIPVRPDTEGQVCPNDTVHRVQRELRDIHQIIKGTDAPGAEVVGVVQLGEQLKEALKKVGVGA